MLTYTDLPALPVKDEAAAAVAAGRLDLATAAVDHVRLAFKAINDAMVGEAEADPRQGATVRRAARAPRR